MKKILAVMLAALMCAAVLASCQKKTENTNTNANANTPDTKTEQTDVKYIQDKGTLVIGITEYEPMNFKDENGEWTGFDTEFAQAVAEKLGVKAEFAEINWDNKAMELDSKAIDCVWNGMTLTTEVTNTMDCSKPYVVNSSVVVAPADKIDSYKTSDDLKDLNLVAEEGSSGAEAIDGVGLTYTGVDTQSKALMEVSAGAADACVIDITMANAMTGEGTSYANLESGLALTEEEYGIGFRKGSDMVEKVNGIIDELKEDGTLTSLAEKYELTLAD